MFGSGQRSLGQSVRVRPPTSLIKKAKLIDPIALRDCVDDPKITGEI